MALPALIPVVMIGARVVARFAASKAGQKAAQKFAKEFGGRVVKKSKDLKSVQKAPTGSKATQQMVSKMKANTINPAKSGMRPGAKPPAAKKPDPRGSTAQKLLLAAATTGLASGVDPSKPKKASGDTGKSTMTDAQLSSGRNRGKDNRAAPSVSKEGAASKRMPKKEPKKMDFRDFKTVAAAQKAGSDFFQGRDGKKKIAITKEQLEKYKNKNKIKTNAEALRSYANMLRKK